MPTAVHCVGSRFPHLAVLYSAGCEFLPLGGWRIEEDLACNHLASVFERRRVKWRNYTDPQRLSRWFGVSGGCIT